MYTKTLHLTQFFSCVQRVSNRYAFYNNEPPFSFSKIMSQMEKYTFIFICFRTFDANRFRLLTSDIPPP